MPDAERIAAIRRRVASEGEWTGGPDAVFWCQQDRRWLLDALTAAGERAARAELRFASDDCRRCQSERLELLAEDNPLAFFQRRMITCPECGDKRCSKAGDHRRPCDV